MVWCYGGSGGWLGAHVACGVAHLLLSFKDVIGWYQFTLQGSHWVVSASIMKGVTDRRVEKVAAAQVRGWMCWAILLVELQEDVSQ